MERTENVGEAFTAYLLAIRNNVMGQQASEKIQEILEDPKNLDTCIKEVKSKPELQEVAIEILKSNGYQDAALELSAN